MMKTTKTDFERGAEAMREVYLSQKRGGNELPIDKVPSGLAKTFCSFEVWTRPRLIGKFVYLAEAEACADADSNRNVINRMTSHTTTLELEKATRVKYQGLVYDICNLVDKWTGVPLNKISIQEVVPEIKRLLSKSISYEIPEGWRFIAVREAKPGEFRLDGSDTPCKHGDMPNKIGPRVIVEKV